MLLSFLKLSLSMMLIVTVGFAKESISLSGSSTVRPIMEQVAKSYETLHPEVEIVINGGGSSVGVRDVGNKKVDIGMASRHLKDFEVRQFPKLKTHLIGYDAIALIVNDKNSIDNLGFEEVQNIYLGDIRNWKVLGGKDMGIIPISKDFGRSTLDFFVYYFDLDAINYNGGRKFILYKKKRHSGGYSNLKCKIIGSNDDVIDFVASNPQAFAYVSNAAAVQAIEKGVAIKMIALDGVFPTEKNIYKGKYPIRRDLNLLSYDDASDAVKAFIEFTTQKEGQEIIRKNGLLLKLR